MIRRIVPPTAARAQAKPWLVTRVDERVGRHVWEKLCDTRELQRLVEQEAEIDAVITAAGPYTEDWWRALRKLDRVRTRRIRMEQRG